MSSRTARLFPAILSLLLVEPAGAQPVEAELHLSVLAMSDYQRDGISQTASGPAARFSVDYAHPSAFFAGGYLSNVEYEAERYVPSPREYEINVYAGYAWRRNDWTANVLAARYFYPGTDLSYDYTGIAAGFSLRDRYFLELSGSDDYLDVYGTAYRYLGGIAWPVPWDTELGVNAGRVRYSEQPNSRFSFWDAGVSRVFGSVALDLRYHDSTYDGVSLLGEHGDKRWVFSVSYALMPGRGRGR